MHVLIVDDERLAVQNLKNILKNHQGIHKENIHEYTSPSEALQFTSKHQIDVAFLDIEMAELNGLVVAEKMKEQQPEIEIVFVTAFQEYAIEAFELHALDYLLKPVRPNRLLKTLARIIKRVNKHSDESQIPLKTKICLFGNLDIYNQQGELLEIKWRSGKLKELFSLLMQYRNRFISKYEIIDLLWYAFSDKKAATHLHTTIYRLRQLIYQHQLDIKIIYQNNAYQVKLSETVDVDVDIWLQHLKENPNVNEHNVESCINKLKIYRGRYLENLDFIWSEVEQAHLSTLYEKHVFKIATCLIDLKRYEEAIALYEPFIYKLSYDDKTVITLFDLYKQQNNTQAIEKLYQTINNVYNDELNVPKNAEIENWYQTWKYSR
ncbi:response regulator [Virgibacillus sp. W0430]|uniref:response regulator n=1 Tax=Virgibacillus sp. W0430 TaxID=3391580 RepID=UPI003F4861FE